MTNLVFNRTPIDQLIQKAITKLPSGVNELCVFLDREADRGFCRYPDTDPPDGIVMSDNKIMADFFKTLRDGFKGCDFFSLEILLRKDESTFTWTIKFSDAPVKDPTT